MSLYFEALWQQFEKPQVLPIVLSEKAYDHHLVKHSVQIRGYGAMKPVLTIELHHR